MHISVYVCHRYDETDNNYLSQIKLCSLRIKARLDSSYCIWFIKYKCCQKLTTEKRAILYFLALFSKKVDHERKAPCSLNIYQKKSNPTNCKTALLSRAANEAIVEKSHKFWSKHDDPADKHLQLYQIFILNGSTQTSKKKCVENSFSKKMCLKKKTVSSAYIFIRKLKAIYSKYCQIELEIFR